MYFDDCERKDIEELKNLSASWSTPFSEEKQKALASHLGYNYESANDLTVDKVEEETLVWAIDSDVVSVGDCEESNPGNCKFRSFSDLIIASNCATVTNCMALVWKELERLFQMDIASHDDDSVYMIVFPKTKALWEYDTMVTMLQAIEICKALLPSHVDLIFDCFHPDYKNSPRMLSPQSHSPFPTIGIRMVQNKDDYQDVDDINSTRDKLQVLFDSVDAVHSVGSQAKEEINPENVIFAVQEWMKESKVIQMDDKIDYNIEMQKEPYQIWKALWASIEAFSYSTLSSSSLVVTPFLDAHTCHRIAVTVNAALKRFDSGVQIEHVFHPGNKEKNRNAPHGIIHIVKKVSNSG
jgi:hypothetical protein